MRMSQQIAIVGTCVVLFLGGVVWGQQWQGTGTAQQRYEYAIVTGGYIELPDQHIEGGNGPDVYRNLTGQEPPHSAVPGLLVNELAKRGWQMQEAFYRRNSPTYVMVRPVQ